MGIFNSIFGQSEEKSNSKINWIPLTDVNQLDEIKEISKYKPTIIFKHSTRCSVSRMVLKQFENEFYLHEKFDLYYLDLLEHRPISQEIATRFGVVHQSPQLLLIQNETAIYHANHEAIDAEKLITIV
jgi:bacillithiol system protein YtxJ